MTIIEIIASVDIIANVLSFIGNTFFTISAILKSKKKIVLFQSTNYIFAIVAEVMKEAYSGMVQEAVSLVRNIILLFVKEDNKKLKAIISIFCVVVSVVVGVILNVKLDDNVWHGYLPIIGSVVYSTVVIIAFLVEMDALNAELIIKSGLLINSIVWAMYGGFVRLYPIMGFNIANIVLCIISIVRVFVMKRQVKEEKEKSEQVA